MNDKLIRSGAPHSVTFNEATRNALSPKNELSEAEKQEITKQSEVQSAHPPVQLPTNHVAINSNDNSLASVNPIFSSEQINKQSLTVGKKSLPQNNFQKIENDSLLGENNFHDAIQRLEDRIQHFKENHHIDNRQTFSDEANHLRKDMVYLGKKNIKDFSVPISTLESQPSASQFDVEDEKTKPSDESQTQSKETNVTQTKIKPSDTTPQELNDDDLQAQMRLMKEKLSKANQKLIDIQGQDRTDSEM